MATEPTLRHLFDAPQPDNTIDVAAIVQRSRARRAPKVALTAGASVLAIGGMLFGGGQLVGSVSPSTMAGADALQDEQVMGAPEDGALSAESDEDAKRSAASELNQCGAPVAAPEPNENGLVFSLDFADGAVGADSIEGTVTLTNTGAEHVFGYTAVEPTITLAQNGIVVWHSNGPMIELAREVDLAPGESLEYSARFEPVVCGREADLEDDSAQAATAGDYQVSAVIDLMGDFDAQLITGPEQTVTLR